MSSHLSPRHIFGAELYTDAGYGVRPRTVMAEPDSVNAQAKTKRKVLQAHVKFLKQRSTEATTLLSGTSPPDQISSLITVFASTIKKGEELFDLFANVVHDFEASKKVIKKKRNTMRSMSMRWWK